MSETLKVLLLGDAKVGKTALYSRATLGKFNSTYRPTIGADFGVKLLSNLDEEDTKVRLQVWDTAGGEPQSSSLGSPFFRGAHAVVFVYDVSSRDSFSHIQSWISKVGSQDAVKILVANKSDVNSSERQVSISEGHKLAQILEVPFIETSAKDDLNVTTLLTTVAQTARQNTGASVASDEMHREEKDTPVEAKKPDEMRCAGEANAKMMSSALSERRLRQHHSALRKADAKVLALRQVIVAGQRQKKKHNLEKVTAMTIEEREKMKTTFYKLTCGGGISDACVSVDNLMGLGAQLNVVLSQRHLSDLLSIFDSDDDGKLNQEEFAVWWVSEWGSRCCPLHRVLRPEAAIVPHSCSDHSSSSDEDGSSRSD